MSNSPDIITLHERLPNCCDTFSAFTFSIFLPSTERDVENWGESPEQGAVAGVMYLGGGDGGTV